MFITVTLVTNFKDLHMKKHLLQQFPLFSDLTDEALTAIESALEQKTYAKNTLIFHEGQPADKLLIVFDGKVKVFKSNPEGKEHILHIMSKYNMLGEVPLFEGGKYPASCIAMTDVIIFAIPRIKLIALIQHDPQIALNILALQAKRLREFTSKIERLSLKTTEQKLAYYLLQHTVDVDGQHIVSMQNFNIQELANYLGTARENLSRVISKLVRQKIISKQNSDIVIEKFAELEKMYI